MISIFINEFCLKKGNFLKLFRIIRLEFNHSCADYFTEIDAVLLKGSAIFNRNSNTLNRLKMKNSSDRRGYILKRLENFEVRVGDNEQQGQQMLKNFLENDLKEFIRETQGATDDQFSLPDIPVSWLYTYTYVHRYNLNQ